MDDFIKIIDKLLVEINQSINEKICGINYLDLLKFKLIENLKDLEESVFRNLKSNGKGFYKLVDLKNRKIEYKIEIIEKSISKIKYKNEYDNLIIVLNGLKTITIYDNNDDKKYLYSNLSKNMGIVLCVDTIITSVIKEKSIILSIINN